MPASSPGLTIGVAATLQSFSAAALELSYTQSSVSESVATLERELGVTLLDRSSRPVRLTPSGELVLAHAETLLTEAAAIQTNLAALTRGDVGRLRLAGFYTAGSTFLPSAIAEFADVHPHVDLELEQPDPPAALRQLRAGELILPLPTGSSRETRRPIPTPGSAAPTWPMIPTRSRYPPRMPGPGEAESGWPIWPKRIGAAHAWAARQR